ncbi:MAG: tetratricopeptide repeat protein [Verrucomicrobiota bacterium]
MSCLFIALEGFTAAALAAARASGHLPAWDTLATGGRLAELAFPLANARIATLVSAVTGTWPDQHRVFMARARDSATSALRPVRGSDRAQPAVWETLDAQGTGCISVAWPVAMTGTTTRTAIVAAGFGVTPTPEFQPDLARLVEPASLAAGLAECWFRPDDFDAASIAPLVPDWQNVNQAVDSRLGLLSAVLAENVSRHAAFMSLLDSRPWEFATLCLSLPAELASLERASASFGDGLFTGLAQRGLPLLDDFLREILRRLPPDTNLVIAGLPHAESPAQPGFVLLHGPVIHPAARLPQAASVLDLVPLLWSVCGFQTLAPMPGRGLLPAIRAGHPQRAFDMPWQPPADHQPAAMDELLDTRALHLTNHRGAWLPEECWHLDSLGVLGHSLMAHHEALRALPVLDALARLTPGDAKAWLLLSDCQQLLGLIPEALDSAYAAVDARGGSDPAPLLQAATLEVLCGQPDNARALLAQAAPQLAAAPRQWRLQHANVLIFLREWPAATAMLTDIVAAMPGDARALRRLARCHLALRAWQEAFDCAIESVRLDPGHASTHEILAHALHGLGMSNQARQALECAIAEAPEWPRPRAALAMLARRMGKPQAQVDGLIASYQQAKEQDHKRRTALLEAARRLPGASRDGPA